MDLYSMDMAAQGNMVIVVTLSVKCSLPFRDNKIAFDQCVTFRYIQAKNTNTPRYQYCLQMQLV